MGIYEAATSALISQKWNLTYEFYFCCACREVFLVDEEMLLAPKIYSSIPNCRLCIINNDTEEELDVLVNVYQPNEVAAKITERAFFNCTNIFLSLPMVSQTLKQIFMVPSLLRGATPLLQRQLHVKRHLMAPNGDCA